jgi:hypothetical protein
MKDLNEKLAKVCGLTCDGTRINGNPCKKTVYFDGTIGYTPWNPTQDLHQLRECYLALSEDEKEIYKSVSAYDVPHILDDPERHAKYIATIRERTILKTKGVE